ncbi:MAG: hypothetical protein KDC71_23850 [Acidobacteria bacterium]|nr:hypothetical protein [Acidobacteriota bacterium]
MLLSIQNSSQDHRDIESTNFWESDMAKQGGLYVDINARDFRILVPDSMKAIKNEFEGTKYVVITRGFLGPDEALEFMLEDESDSPFAVHVGLQQFTVRPNAEWVGHEDIFCSFWERGPKLIKRWHAKYRLGAALPDLRPWR